ncbi:MAG: hypothetical protein WKG00_38920 [Polyangiaceae bacterium]
MKRFNAPRPAPRSPGRCREQYCSSQRGQRTTSSSSSSSSSAWEAVMSFSTVRARLASPALTSSEMPPAASLSSGLKPTGSRTRAPMPSASSRARARLASTTSK